MALFGRVQPNGKMKFLTGILATVLGLGFILFPTLSMVGGNEVQGGFFVKLIGGFLLIIAGLLVLWLEARLARFRHER